MNKDHRIIKVRAEDKRHVKRLRRRAEHHALRGEALGRNAARATRRGWWYA